MGEEIKRAIKSLQLKLGKEIKNEPELSDRFLNEVIMPYLRNHMGLIADVKLERRIKRGRYDARIGALVIEFENPFGGIEKGISQAKEYVRWFGEKGESVKCLVTNGREATFVDERLNVGEVKSILDLAFDLQEQLALLAKIPIEPEDLLKVISPDSDICRSHVRNLVKIFEKEKGYPFVSECLQLWKGVYGEAANLNKEAVNAVIRYAKNMDIDLATKEDVEDFLFVIETYLSIFMKLLVTAIATQRKLIRAENVREILFPEPLVAFEALGNRVPFLRGAFEHDAFSWFVDSAKRDKQVGEKLAEIIQNVGITLDRVNLAKIRSDLLRQTYQRFFDPQTRKALGEFYTSEEIVEEVLEAVNYKGKNILDKTTIDPACGSGTFLIAAIRRFTQAGKKARLTNIELVRKISEQVVGIDVHPFAVTMARVNYILALSPLIDQNMKQQIRELKIPIYWTDSLASFSKRPEVTGVPVVEVEVTPLGKFLLPDPKEFSWSDLLSVLKKAVDSDWEENRFLQEFPEDYKLDYKNTLLSLFRRFKARARLGRDSRWLSTLRNVTVVDAFKGRCHFVVGNPPWVRFENVDKELKSRIEEKFAFYGKKASWHPKLKKIKVALERHVDYSLAFVEASLGYLCHNGRFGFVITSNVIRSLYSGRMRRILIEKTTLLTIKDYSLAKVQLFEGAQNAPLILTFEKREPENGHKVKVEMVNRKKQTKSWEIEQRSIPLIRTDTSSPFMIAPPKVVEAIRKMQEGTVALGNILGANEGIATAANRIFFVRKFRPTDQADIVTVETGAGEKIRIEKELLAPVIRGKNIDPWVYDVKSYMVLPHKGDGEVLTKLPENAEKYFMTHESELRGRKRWQISSAIERGTPFWVAASPSKLRMEDKVAWQMIARTIEAAYLPSKVEDSQLGHKKLIVDHSLHFFETEDKELSLALTGILNSTPARTYTATYVNRTGAAYCQYFGWIIGLIPVPKDVISGRAKEVSALAKRIHAERRVQKDSLALLDKVVSETYGLQKYLSSMKDFLEFFSVG